MQSIIGLLKRDGEISKTGMDIKCLGVHSEDSTRVPQSRSPAETSSSQ